MNTIFSQCDLERFVLERTRLVFRTHTHGALQTSITPSPRPLQPGGSTVVLQPRPSPPPKTLSSTNYNIPVPTLNTPHSKPDRNIQSPLNLSTTTSLPQHPADAGAEPPQLVHDRGRGAGAGAAVAGDEGPHAETRRRGGVRGQDAPGEPRPPR